MAPSDPNRRRTLRGLAGAGLSLALGSCGSAGPALPPIPSAGLTRSFRMGFSHSPPRPTVAAVIEGINHWSQRAELAIVHEELPWAKLLAGQKPAAILQADKVDLVKYQRSKGLSLFFMLDLTNGLGREGEAPALVAAGRSLSEPAVQQLAIDYAGAVSAILTPEWLGLAAETNLIRAIAPSTLYQAVKTTAAAIEAALAAAGSPARRFVSVQAEAAWGRLATRESYRGVAQDFADFPFIQALGISSYPYLAWDDPAAIPADYYTRLRGQSRLPVIVTEGGWTSASVPPVRSSAARQAAYIASHAELLGSVQAIAWLQLFYSDLDLDAYPPPHHPLLPLFASLGLTDADFRAKPALAAWDSVFARRLVQGGRSVSG